MSDTFDDYAAMREHGANKRRQNTKSSTQILNDARILFEIKNNGAHLIVENRFDFWPSTGLFVERSTGKKDRGVFNLLKKLKK